jgi:hypothetical protein
MFERLKPSDGDLVLIPPCPAYDSLTAFRSFGPAGLLHRFKSEVDHVSLQ